jgi:hypothetical protein
VLEVSFEQGHPVADDVKAETFEQPETETEIILSVSSSGQEANSRSIA